MQCDTGSTATGPPSVEQPKKDRRVVAYEDAPPRMRVVERADGTKVRMPDVESIIPRNKDKKPDAVKPTARPVDIPKPHKEKEADKERREEAKTKPKQSETERQCAKLRELMEKPGTQPQYKPNPAPSTAAYYSAHAKKDDSGEQESKEERRRKRREIMGITDSPQGALPTLLQNEFDEYRSVAHDRREKVSLEDGARNLRRGLLEDRMNEMGLSEKDKMKPRGKLLQAENQCLKAQQHEYRADDFTVIKTLGQGGFGTVYKVTYRDGEKVMALKQMPRKTLMGKNDLEHLFSETNCLATVYTSPFFPLLYSCFADTDNVYLLMEFLEGGDLITLLSQMRRFSEDMTKFYMAELVEAVDFVHRTGYVHRDIKPDNLCFTKDGHLKLLDFGLAKEDPGLFTLEEGDAARFMRTQVGTPYYMAPEIIVQVGYTASVDIWAIGCVVFDCLVGGSPFVPSVAPGDTQSAIIRKIFKLVKNYETVLPPLYTKYAERRYLSNAAVALFRGIFTAANKRLTLNEVRLHPFFEGIDFSNLLKTQPPYVPPVKKENALVRTHKPKAKQEPKTLKTANAPLGEENFDLVNFKYDVAARAPNVNACLA